MKLRAAISTLGLAVCGFAGCLKSVETLGAFFRARRTNCVLRSPTRKRWIPAFQRMSSREHPLRVEGVMAVLAQVLLLHVAWDQHHVTKLRTVRSHRPQSLPSSLLWSADGVGSTCAPPCRCMRGSQLRGADPQLGDLQRRSPAAPRIGCFYGHGAMTKPLGRPRGGARARGRISKCGRDESLGRRCRTLSAPRPSPSLGWGVAMGV